VPLFDYHPESIRSFVDTVSKMVEHKSRVDRRLFLLVRGVVWMASESEFLLAVRRASREICKAYGFEDLTDAFEFFESMDIGELEAQDLEDDLDERMADLGDIVVSVYDCVSCSGAPNVGETLCAFEGHIILGAVEAITGDKMRVIEYKCWGLGDRVCKFVLFPQGDLEAFKEARSVVEGRKGDR